MNKYHKSPQNQPPTPVPGASNRPSTRSEFENREVAAPGGKDEGLGSGSIPFLGIAFHPAARPASKAQKLSRAQLTELEERLTARDHAVLQTIRKYRFLVVPQTCGIPSDLLSRCK